MQEIENRPTKRRQISLRVNEREVDAVIDCRMTLAEFLRQEMGLTGTKVGCNRGECGSCTVLLEGIPVYSCSVLAVEAEGKEVLTIESLTDHGKLHPLQETFVDHDALQCGYCTPGMIMSATALLAENPDPTEDDVRKAIDGNFCRCGCYPNIVRAVLEVSQKMKQRKRG